MCLSWHTTLHSITEHEESTLAGRGRVTKRESDLTTMRGRDATKL
jgi:hypothetical protein